VNPGAHRDLRLVNVRLGGTLPEEAHRQLSAWAAECAERVLPLFESVRPGDGRPRRAVEAAYAWARGEIRAGEARTAALAAHAAARETDTAHAGAREAARAAGQAASVAHMPAHELGAAMYAIRAIRAAAPEAERMEAGRAECRRQRSRLPNGVRNLVLDDQRLRNAKCGHVFSDEADERPQITQYE